jgi:hypothetical protein
MSTWTGRPVGTSFGYMGGHTYELSNGSHWHQIDRTDDPVCREYPAARLLDDGMGFTCLDGECTSATVRVMPVGRRPKNPTEAC